ncbi:Selenocysteine lyase/Cysteine desulfurase [Fodinibius roseus]|uniref:Selenocysteine lyase/Cysteine desulfurase n=1 Tax=Fodinibius roseus TaxID=1194090 RepID=A0A1M4USU4_9BACT|nr:aminotransferase class V-fold PLP-dependent enzyme [Fodinibius roseus]SHE59693.1 Selenocysteine lyase/Cysteine desulfurase [Fodinibius roseus]
MDCQKKLFSLPDNHHYLNCAYMSPLLKSVEEAGIQGIQIKRRPWNITPEHFFEDSSRLRNLFSRLINAGSARDIAILPATSYGLSTVAKNMDPSRGKTIITAGQQFPSNVYAWKRFCRTHNCRIKAIKAPTGFKDRGERWNERILEAIDSDTLLVTLGHVHWTDGTLFKLQEIGEQARMAGAYFVVDGTQSVGALPFDVQDIQPDALICSGYKWLMGPYSIALGYFGKRFKGGLPLEEGWITRKDSENFSGLVQYTDKYQSGAVRFDVGERSNFVLVPMMIEALQQLIRWGPQHIGDYCRELTADIVQELPHLGYRIEQPAWRADHLFGIRLPEHLDPAELEQELSRRNIHVSLRGSALRISPNVYNSQQDTDALLDVLSQQ